MRKTPPDILERGRIRHGPLASTSDYGMMGAFVLKGPGRFSHRLKMISSGEDEETGWEHVSVSIHGKKITPSWEEMAFVKQLFWRDDETVMELHVPSTDHVNNHPGTLHLWRPIEKEIPRPEASLVGIPGLTPDDFAQLKR